MTTLREVCAAPPSATVVRPVRAALPSIPTNARTPLPLPHRLIAAGTLVHSTRPWLSCGRYAPDPLPNGSLCLQACQRLQPNCRSRPARGGSYPGSPSYGAASSGRNWGSLCADQAAVNAIRRDVETASSLQRPVDPRHLELAMCPIRSVCAHASKKRRRNSHKHEGARMVQIAACKRIAAPYGRPNVG